MSSVDPVAIEKKVKEGLARVLSKDIAIITTESRLIEDLNIDSFAGVELVFELEDSTGIEILQADFINLKTVGDVTAHICKCLELKKES